MKWIKKGLFFPPSWRSKWMVTHAWIPTLDHIEGDFYKIYFGSRNKENLSQIGYIIIDISKPEQILKISEDPVLELGPLGTFDDSAVLPSCIVNCNNIKYMYYIGWMQGKRVPYYASLGLAISQDEGKTFKKFSKGPILPRNNIDPYMTASADIMVEKGLWRMYYLSNTQWTIEDGRPKPRYHIKYAESKDAVNWQRVGVVCIDFKSDDEYAIARPCVIKEDGIYKMWYSYRGESYRIGYAESTDGINWSRKDKDVGIDVSESGWDSEMIEYSFIVRHKGSKYMFYNGNNYGETGIGYAVMEQ